MVKFNVFFLTLFISFFNTSASAQFFKSVFSKSEEWSFNKEQESHLKHLLRQDIQFLSSFQLNGRKVGDLGSQNAALYIKNRLESMHVETLNLPNHFEVSTNKRLSANTRLTINNFLIRIPEEAKPLPFSNNHDFQGYFLIGTKEPLTPWVLPLFDSKEDAEKFKNDWIDKAYSIALKAEKFDVKALFLYDPYSIIDLTDIENAAFKEVNLPVIILSTSVYKKHLINNQSLTSISLQLDLVDIQSETENVYAFINHNSDKTIILSASYDYLGSYYDQSLPYGNNKIVNYGADKNASGVAGVLALVDMLQMKKDLGNDYNYLIAFYSASQLGHQGVNHFLKYLPNIMKQQVVAAIHLDHIGRYQQDKGLYVMGSNHSGMNEQLANRSTSSRLHFNIEGSISKDSDAYFYEKDHIPTLQFHTGNITDHGTPADHPSKINYLNIWNIVFSIYQGIFSAEPSLQKLSNKTSTTDKNVNYTKTPVKWEEWGIQIDKNYEGLGVKLLSLSNDGLAKRIKLEEGDIVFNINKKPVVTLEDLESVLKTITYDEEITIKIKRDVSVLDINTKI